MRLELFRLTEKSRSYNFMQHRLLKDHEENNKNEQHLNNNN
jgi:hypothetical protein